MPPSPTEEVDVGEDRSRRGTELALLGDGAVDARSRALESTYQALWFTLARSNWNSLVVVPADRDDTAAGLATALAEVGRRLRNTPVTFLVMAGSIDYASAGKFVSTMAGRGGKVEGGPPSSRVIVAVPPVVAEPLALAVTDAADAVALFMRKGVSRLDSAERTIEMVGRSRFLGCVLG
jgi:hypothetical protein